jgi:hypothetical protein
MTHAQYLVYVPKDGLGGDYINPSPRSQHRSLAAAIRAARSHGHRIDGDAVAFVQRIQDDAQLDPWSDPTMPSNWLGDRDA